MTIKFLEKLSIDYLGLLEDKEDFNVIVNIKESSDTKTFYAHSNVLRYRSLYFRNELANISKNEDNIKIVNLKHVSTQQFEIIVKYIYGGTILLENQDTLFICELMIVAHEFLLEELAKYLEAYLIEKKAHWLRLNFARIYQTSFQNQQLQELQKWCNNIVAKYPEKIFETENFISLQENALVSLIKRDDLQLEEIKIWNYVIQWGIAQNPDLPPDPKNWSRENFLALKTTLQNCLPLIRYFQISGDDINDKVKPYKKILEKNLWEDIMQKFLTPGRSVSTTILPSRIVSSPILPSRATDKFSSSWVKKQTKTYSTSAASGGNIKVVIRCRPLNSRELVRGAKCLIRMEGNQTIITRPTDATGPGNSKAAARKGEEDVKSFTFDKSYWSFDKNDPNYATQVHLYNDLGEDLLNHAFGGYNTCIFAYGQTGAGKSYSMMGYGEDKGIIPLTCCELFNRIGRNCDNTVTYQVQVSYIQIYNERVRDLLNPKNKGNLKVREHPTLGPYVEDLSKLIVNSFQDIEYLMDEGNKARAVAATNMNETSSRSHAIFTLILTQKRHDAETNMDTEKVSRISLVDLAGSERANSTGATGARLKEGANINKSLTTFGKVIASLADASSGTSRKGAKKADSLVPYRDSVLTWLLKDSLGGNSKTAMIAAISPTDYDETLSTLRYADAVKRIKNKAVVNEDPNVRLIRELKEELQLLRKKLGVEAGDSVFYDSDISDNQQVITFEDCEGNVVKKTKEELVDQIQASEKLMKEACETWQEKLRRTEEIQLIREKTLEELGILIEKNAVGVHPPKKVPHLVNLNEDPLMSECLVYQIKPGETRVGRLDSDIPSDIRLGGEKIMDNHCYFENEKGVVTLHPSQESITIVNGMRISKPRKLRSGFRIILGDFHVFRFNNPEEVRREREKNKPSLHINPNIMPPSSRNVDDIKAPDSPTSMASLVSEAVIDWNYARREMALNYLNPRPEANLSSLPDEDLQRLMDDLKKIARARRILPDSRSNDFEDY